MRTGAKLYIGAILAGGVVCFAHAMAGWDCRHPLQYLCLLAVALPASTLKVFLPGVVETISVGFVFISLGMLDFSYPETVLAGCLAMFVHCWWRTKHHPKVLHLEFSLASTAIAVSLGFGAYRAMAGRGSCSGRKNSGARNGASASMVTTHGEIVVAKFFPKNGPSGWYSHRWMSRADQSFNKQRPNRCSSASATGTG